LSVFELRSCPFCLALVVAAVLVEAGGDPAFGVPDVALPGSGLTVIDDEEPLVAREALRCGCCEKVVVEAEGAGEAEGFVDVDGPASDRGISQTTASKVGRFADSELLCPFLP
jgi:hypothetical protein